MTVMEKQLDLLSSEAVQVRPVERVRAGLLNTEPTPVHAGDPPTAWQASVLAALRAPTLRKRVLVAFWQFSGDQGLTDYELSNALSCLRTSAGKRRLELQRIGLVRDSGKRRPTDTATAAVCWELTAEGEKVALAPSNFKTWRT